MSEWYSDALVSRFSSMTVRILCTPFFMIILPSVLIGGSVSILSKGSKTTREEILCPKPRITVSFPCTFNCLILPSVLVESMEVAIGILVTQSGLS